ncbi:HAMP domain-containing histidine kinase [Candidatus Beckwithbacteria bacterium]|nr:HAMP domain-containing histidine kinase [Candidatus Beckwithbacteria bacterium]
MFAKLNLFQSARLKLTAWYILTIGIILFIFSTVIYQIVVEDMKREFHRLYMMQKFDVKIPRGNVPPPIQGLMQGFETGLDEEYLTEFNQAKNEWKLKLFMINGLILLIAGGSAYILAGKNLKPIEEMTEKQKNFIADASHELRTPLTSLKTAIEVNLRAKKIEEKEFRKILADNLEDINALQKLTNYLLDLTKVDNINLTFEDLNLKDLIQKVVDKFMPIAIKKKLTISTKLKNVFLTADKLKLEQLISILLDNAIKYTGKNGKIWIELTTNKKYVYLKIKDNGIGIEKENLKKIFDRFYRAEQSRTSKGFGLGLAIAANIVESHHGKIEVQSEPGKGSEFIVKLRK